MVSGCVLGDIEICVARKLYGAAVNWPIVVAEESWIR